MKPAEKIPVLLERLREAHPDARYELNWSTPFELLVAAILAAQCTDERVNRVTATLFPKYPGPQAFADADTAGLEEDLKPTGFYKQKTKSVQAMSRALLEDFSGVVPQTVDELVTLPGPQLDRAVTWLSGALAGSLAQRPGTGPGSSLAERAPRPPAAP